MTTYKSIVGQKIQKVSSDPPTAAGGQIWYNTTTGILKGIPFLQAWASVGSVTVARRTPGGTGPQTAALACGGGNPSPALVSTEEYNGSGWAVGADLGTGRYAGTAAGDQTSGLYYGGATSSNVERDETEEYNGTSWSEQNNLSQARQRGAGAGSQTAALFFGGSSYVPATVYYNLTEEYGGTSWTSGGALNNRMRGQAGFGTQTAALSACGNEPTLAISEEYNGTSWTSGNSANTARTNISGGGIQTSGLIFGGTTDGSSGNRTGATEAYDGTSFTNVPSLSTSRRLGGGAGTDQNAGLYFAGYTTTDISLTEEFTSSTNVITAGAWASGGNLLYPRSSMAGGGTQTAAIEGSGSQNNPDSSPTTSSEYNGSSWTAGNTTPANFRGNNSATGTQTALITGGLTNASNTETFEYNGSSWTAGGDIGTGRYKGGCFGTQTAAAFCGGRVSPPTLNNVEEYNGSSWTAVTAMPFATRQAGAGGTQTAGIIHGGFQGPTSPPLSPTNSVSRGKLTLEYDGSSWTTGGSSNTGRDTSASSGIQTLLNVACGNTDASNNSNTTENYNGTSWVTGPNTSIGRADRASASSRTSAVGTACLIFGGTPSGGSPEDSNNTEEFTAETTAVNVKILSTS